MQNYRSISEGALLADNEYRVLPFPGMSDTIPRGLEGLVGLKKKTETKNSNPVHGTAGTSSYCAITR